MADNDIWCNDLCDPIFISNVRMLLTLFQARTLSLPQEIELLRKIKIYFDAPVSGYVRNLFASVIERLDQELRTAGYEMLTMTDSANSASQPIARMQ